MLGGLLALATAIVIWQTHHPIVRSWVIGAIAIPWVALGIVLRIKPDTLGVEGKYFDLWSIPHFTAGVLFALFGISLGWLVAIATIWEVVEIYARSREYPANRVADVVLAAAGWLLANAIAGGAFPLL
ncbi:MAG TPA: hypothetical protein VIV11_22940 [Kofleriaceae bacterium]